MRINKKDWYAILSNDFESKTSLGKAIRKYEDIWDKLVNVIFKTEDCYEEYECPKYEYINEINNLYSQLVSAEQDVFNELESLGHTLNFRSQLDRNPHLDQY